MKKFATHLLSVLLALVLVFAAGCSANVYDGDYAEATPEQRDAALEKIRTAAEAESSSSTNYEFNSKFDMTVKSGDSSIGMKGTIYGVIDNSEADKEKDYYFWDFTNKIVEGGTTIESTIKMSFYVDYANDKVFLDYSAESTYNGESDTESYKGVIPMSELSELTGQYTDFLAGESGMSIMLRINEFESLFEESAYVFYVDGNKYKWVDYIGENSTSVLYLIINDDNSYQAKLVEDVNVLMKTEMTGSESVTIKSKSTSEIKPVKKTVTLPEESAWNAEQA